MKKSNLFSEVLSIWFVYSMFQMHTRVWWEDLWKLWFYKSNVHGYIWQAIGLWIWRFAIFWAFTLRWNWKAYGSASFAWKSLYLLLIIFCFSSKIGNRFLCNLSRDRKKIYNLKKKNNLFWIDCYIYLKK